MRVSQAAPAPKGMPSSTNSTVITATSVDSLDVDLQGFRGIRKLRETRPDSAGSLSCKRESTRIPFVTPV